MEVIGKTISELQSVAELTDGFMFLGCRGTDASYSTYKTTYGALKRDLSSAIIDSIDSKTLQRLEAVEEAVRVSDDSIYVKKNGENQQLIKSAIRFKNDILFDSSVNFCNFRNDSSINYQGDYGVLLPKDTFRGETNQGVYNRNDDYRVATGGDIKNAVQNLRTSLSAAEQILDVNYYGSPVRVSPQYKNSSYRYDLSGDAPNVFYRYAGIRRKMPSEPSQTQAEIDGRIYRQANGFTGIPLSKSYRNFLDLTVVCLRDASPESNVGAAKMIHSVTIPVFDIDLARQYVEYKSQFVHTQRDESYFDKVADKWYFGDTTSSILYLSIKVTDTFTDKFLPLQFSGNGYSVIAVFGRG